MTRPPAAQPHAPHHGLREQLAVLRRRKWWIVACVLAVPVGAVLLSVRQPAQFQAKSQVLLNRQNLSNALTNTLDPSLADPDRVAQTQARLARVTEIARRVVASAGVPALTASEFLGASSVAIAANADVLDFRVNNHVPAFAEKLATAYAQQYIVFRRELDTASLQRARIDVEQHLRQLAAAGERRSALYAALAEKDQQLRTMEALQTSNASVVQAAEGASKVAPRPVRNGILALLLGGLLGFGLAFLRESLDTGIRTAEELAERLGMPLLARIPEPPRRLQAVDRLVTVAEPSSPQADAFRVLRMNLAFANHDLKAKTIMVTSAVKAEGKSTTVANLAVSLARAGHRVALVDLDLRRPYVDRFFALRGSRGLTEAALGQVSLEFAMRRIVIGRDDQARVEENGNGNGHGNGDGNGISSGYGNGAGSGDSYLYVLGSGATPPDPGEFVGSTSIGGILDRLREEMDFVLVDTPPMLTVGDALTLSEKVDAIIVIARSSVVRRPMVAELRRQLDSCPAEKLGFVLTQAEAEEGYGYGYGHQDGYAYMPRQDDDREHARL